MNGEFKKPEKLFRFFAPDRSALFAEKRLFFSRADSFNDPFEVCPRYDKIIPEMIDKAERMHFRFNAPPGMSFLAHKHLTKPSRERLTSEYLESSGPTFQKKFSEHYGIVCFTSRIDSLLMWAHYAGGHAGFAVEFTPDHALFSPRDFGKVIYSTDRCMMTITAHANMLLHKSREWEYEQEYRLIRKRDELSPIKGDDGKTVSHFLPLPVDAVKAVYFGTRMEANTKRAILEALAYFPLAKVFFMRRHPTEYKLEAAPLAEWKEPSSEFSDLILKQP